MNLDQLQRAVWEVIQQPLNKSEGMRSHLPDGRSMNDVVEAIIKPNDRLTSFERLEIYNRQYWFRILSALAEDFPGLRAILGEKQFEKLSIAYLTECASESFTLRNLGARLPGWLMNHLEFVEKTERISMDMVRLEWADIEVFDSAEKPALTQDDLASLGDDPCLPLQPHIRLLDLSYPVDDLLLKIRQNQEERDIASNAVVERTRRTKIRHSSLPKPEKAYLVLYRMDNSVYFKRLNPESFALLRALQEGKPLSAAIEASVNWTSQDVEQITSQLHKRFANWSSLKWFCRA